MTTLKTIHDTDTGDPIRLKYNGSHIDAGFEITEKGVAVLDSILTREIYEGEDEAVVDLEELHHAVNLAESVEYVGRVAVLEEVFMND